MMTRHEYGKATWIDLLNPTSEEIRALYDECNLPAEFSNDLMGMTPRTETRVADDALKITLDFPIVKRTDITHPHEVKFIATKTHCITIRFEDMERIHKFSKEIEVIGILKSAGKNAHGGHIFLALLSYLYEGLNIKLDYLESRVHDIENEMFNDNEREILFDISQVSRRTIAFGQVLNAHGSALNDLAIAVEDVFGKTYKEPVETIIKSYEHLTRRVDALMRMLENLRDTDNALLSAKQNEVMKMLTIMAFITFPLSLFSSLFGMNTKTLPIAGSDGDFWIIVGIMLIVSVGFFAFFKYRKWM